MTVVAIWYEPVDDLLWSVADTRISVPGSSGGSIIRTDSGAKLLALPVSCRALSKDPNLQPLPHYTTTLGFGFAGDVLPATLTFATASTFLQNLVTATSKNPPHLSAVAKLVSCLAERFSNECLSNSGGSYGHFSSVVFGWCPHERQYQIYRIHPEKVTDQLTMTMKLYAPTDDAEVVAFGTGVKSFEEELNRIRARVGKASTTVSSRLPKLAIQAMVESGLDSDVGGSLSIGLSSHTGFQPMSWVRPKEPGLPQAVMSFNGIDTMQEIGTIDQYIIGLSGMV